MRKKILLFALIMISLSQSMTAFGGDEYAEQEEKDWKKICSGGSDEEPAYPTCAFNAGTWHVYYTKDADGSYTEVTPAPILIKELGITNQEYHGPMSQLINLDCACPQEEKPNLNVAAPYGMYKH